MIETAETGPSRSALQGGESAGVGGGDFGWRLFGKNELELLKKQPQVRFGLSIAGELEFAAVGGRDMDIDHLHGGTFVEDGPWGQSGREPVQAPPEGHVQTIGQERDEDMSLDPPLRLVINWSDRKIILEGLECLFNSDELEVIFPQYCRVFLRQIAAEKIASLASANLTKLCPIQ